MTWVAGCLVPAAALAQGAAPLPLLDLLGHAGSRGDETMKPATPTRGWMSPPTAFGRVASSCLAPEDL